MSQAPSYTLHYWPTIPGRGEFVRLAFEAVGQMYKENDENVPNYSGSSTLTGYPTHFAVPLLEIANAPLLSDKGDAKDTDKTPHSVFLSQTPAILDYLAIELQLDGTTDLENKSEQALALRRAHVLQLTLTALDLANEVHDTHHPIDVAFYYDEQKPEAKRRADQFRASRLPKFLKHFGQTLAASSSGYLVGSSLTVADLTLFQVVDGLKYAFPRRMAVLAKQDDVKHVLDLHKKVASQTHIARYLESERRKSFSEYGIFRHYPELDGEQ